METRPAVRARADGAMDPAATGASTPARWVLRTLTFSSNEVFIATRSARRVSTQR